MPVSDFNATKMGIEAVSVIETTETVSNFWKLNPAIISFALIGAIIVAAFLFLIFYLITRLTKTLHKRNL